MVSRDSNGGRRREYGIGGRVLQSAGLFGLGQRVLKVGSDAAEPWNSRSCSAQSETDWG